jgi:hypothetical protein
MARYETKMKAIFYAIKLENYTHLLKWRE